ncbi:BON domain-containing protein [Paraburkholderia unamae]|uniref:BON domain-containing protein n=1 Tax=Paraburkholderia unamae TaxID=219649 RepID=UPI000DC3E77D|nr:BON domain-containing protein [Paraburkholderia unamae]RAR63853.1 BON domain-containing protein [Paraburkholderia unamae]
MNFTRDGRMFAMAMLFAASLQAHAQGGEAPASAPLGEAASADAAPAPSKAADRALRRRVLNALAKAKGLRASGISVRATHGAVTLEGWVPEQAQIDQATRVAQGVTGVNSVKNTLTLSTF